MDSKNSFLLNQNSRLLVKSIKFITRLSSFQPLVKRLKLIDWIGSFHYAPNSYVTLALVVGLLFQFLNPLSVLAYKEGDFPGIGNETDWDNANQYYKRGNHTNGEEACKLYLKAISIYPYDAAFWNNLGTHTKDNKKAIEYYQKAIKLNPNVIAPCSINLGNSYSKSGQHENSINCYQKALKLEPTNGHLYDSIGNEYLALKKYKEAMPYFQRLTELNPEVEDGFYNLGQCLFFTHNYPKAIELCKKSLVITPNDWMPNEIIGLSLYKMGKIKEALTFKDKAYSLAKSKEDKDMIIKDFADVKSGKL